MKKIKDIRAIDVYSIVSLLPLIASTCTLFVQLYWFAFTGEWIFTGDRLAIAIISSLLLATLNYRLYLLYIKLNTNKDV